jgi:hypothetical protein
MLVSLPDVPLDGRPDVLISSFNDNTTSWFKNLGGSPIAWAGYVIEARPGTPGPMSVTAGPVNADDSRVDVVVVAQTAGQVCHRVS